MNKKTKKTALSIAKGKVVTSNINKNFRIKKRKKITVATYVAGILRGDRVLLGRAITLIESTQIKHQNIAHEIVEKCLAHSGKSFRLGLTGTPGVGKSTFIESFGKQVLGAGHKLAVLAVDPTSQVTGGSILGDKTRMEGLSTNIDAFIRPSPAGGTLGGVARATRESIILCEAAGYDFVIVETVGVGQSEVAVHSMVDFFLLLLLPNAGDELQGIKRGVMEMADFIAINKADGDVVRAAKLAKKQCKNALHLFPPKASDWIATAETCSALNNLGMDSIWKHIQSFENQTKNNGYFEHNRQQQSKYWLEETIGQLLQNQFYNNPTINQSYSKIEQEVIEGKISPFKAAEKLMQIFNK